MKHTDADIDDWKTPRVLLEEYGTLLIELYNTGDSMAVSQAICEELRKIEKVILHRMEKP